MTWGWSWTSREIGFASPGDDVGVADVVNLLTVFMVVRAESHEAAARLFEGHPHCTVFPCEASL